MSNIINNLITNIEKQSTQLKSIQNATSDVVPENVQLRDFDDFDTLRKNMYEKSKDALLKSFPKEYGSIRLEVEDVDYEDPEYYDIPTQKNALMNNKFLNRRLRGNIKLVDKETEKELDKKKTTFMQVPFLTERGTFIHNGNEYSINNQFRLQPGVYARKKQSGDLESQFNVRRGTGKNFKIRFEPETALYKVDVGSSSIKLYSLLNMMGVDDEKIRKTWGDEIFETNKEKYDPRDFEKAYQNFMGFRADKNATNEQKIQSIKDTLSNSRLKFDVVKNTLPDYFND